MQALAGPHDLVLDAKRGNRNTAQEVDRESRQAHGDRTRQRFEAAHRERRHGAPVLSIRIPGALGKHRGDQPIPVPLEDGLRIGCRFHGFGD